MALRGRTSEKSKPVRCNEANRRACRPYALVVQGCRIGLQGGVIMLKRHDGNVCSSGRFLKNAGVEAPLTPDGGLLLLCQPRGMRQVAVDRFGDEFLERLS